MYEKVTTNALRECFEDLKDHCAYELAGNFPLTKKNMSNIRSTLRIMFNRGELIRNIDTHMVKSRRQYIYYYRKDETWRPKKRLSLPPGYHG